MGLNTAAIWNVVDNTQSVTVSRRWTNNGAYSNTTVTALSRPAVRPGSVGFVPGIERVFLLQAADLSVDVLPGYGIKDAAGGNWVIKSVANNAMGATLRCDCVKVRT